MIIPMYRIKGDGNWRYNNSLIGDQNRQGCFSLQRLLNQTSNQVGHFDGNFFVMYLQSFV